MTAENSPIEPLDSEIATALAGPAGAVGGLLAGLSDETIEMARGAFRSLPAPELSGAVHHEDCELPDRGGAWLRIYRPRNVREDAPCIFWMHGGGLVLGFADGEDLRFDEWCTKLDVVGVSMDYRLAPEHPYPTPLEDCYEGLRWVIDHAAELGINPHRVGVGGSSAGGGLAAALCLLARDRGELAISFQVLIYPMLDDRQITISSQWAEPVWPPSANSYAWAAYLGEKAGSSEVDGYAAAARATNLSGLPPAILTVGSLDGFRDEDAEFADRLRGAGVPTELHVYSGAPHGFDALAPDASVSKQMNHDLLRFLQHHTA